MGADTLHGDVSAESLLGLTLEAERIAGLVAVYKAGCSDCFDGEGLG